jgi:hypothetical protein
MHPTHQGVTLDFEQYDKLKDVDKVLPTLLPELKNMLLCQFTESISQQNVTMVLDDTNRLTPYHIIHGWFPVIPFHYIAFCPLRYIPKK